MRNAAQEHYGESVTVSIGADYRLRLPTFQGGARLYDITATTTGLHILLPAALVIRTGASIFTILNRSTSSGALAVYAQDGTTAIGSIPVGQSGDLHLIDNSTANGVWSLQVYSSLSKGTDLSV